MRAWRDLPCPGHGTDLAWTPAGPRVVGTSTLRVPCPFCRAPVGHACTRLVPRHGHIRRPPHDARIRAAETDAHTAVESPGS